MHGAPCPSGLKGACPQWGGPTLRANQKAGAERAAEVPVVVSGVLHGQQFELLVHASVEVVPQEEGPEAEQSVHLLGLARTNTLPLWTNRNTAGSSELTWTIILVHDG